MAIMKIRLKLLECKAFPIATKVAELKSGVLSMDEDQAKFFDRIYPQISQRLHSLENESKIHHYQLTELRSEIKVMNLTVEQYKKKIQKIEQALIKEGLSNILKG